VLPAASDGSVDIRIGYDFENATSADEATLARTLGTIDEDTIDPFLYMSLLPMRPTLVVEFSPDGGYLWTTAAKFVVDAENFLGVGKNKFVTVPMSQLRGISDVGRIRLSVEGGARPSLHPCMTEPSPTVIKRINLPPTLTIVEPDEGASIVIDRLNHVALEAVLSDPEDATMAGEMIRWFVMDNNVWEYIGYGNQVKPVLHLRKADGEKRVQFKAIGFDSAGLASAEQIVTVKVSVSDEREAEMAEAERQWLIDKVKLEEMAQNGTTPSPTSGNETTSGPATTSASASETTTSTSLIVSAGASLACSALAAIALSFVLTL